MMSYQYTGAPNHLPLSYKRDSLLSAVEWHHEPYIYATNPDGTPFYGTITERFEGLKVITSPAYAINYARATADNHIRNKYPLSYESVPEDMRASLFTAYHAKLLTDFLLGEIDQALANLPITNAYAPLKDVQWYQDRGFPDVIYAHRSGEGGCAIQTHGIKIVYRYAENFISPDGTLDLHYSIMLDPSRIIKVARGV